MSYARGRSVIARKEQAYLRRHPGTLDSTVQYLAEKRRPERQAKEKKLAWIGQAVKEFHDEQKEMAPPDGDPSETNE